MADFEDRLRRALHEYADDPPAPVELTGRIEALIRHRQRQRRAGWGIFTVAVAALLVAFVALVGGSTPPVHVVVPPAGGAGQVASPIVPPAPGTTAVDVLDLTWISPTDGWLLGTPQGCTQPDCPALILATNDGGQTWHEAPAPALSCDQTAGAVCPDVSGIRFATTNVGYLFGGFGGGPGNPFFMTTDGGLSWVLEGSPDVLGLEAMDGTAIRVTQLGSGCPGPCHVQVEQAPIGSSNFKVVLGAAQTPSTDVTRVTLARQSGGDVYLAVYANPASGAPNQHAALYVSHDGGTSWQDDADPCGGTAAGPGTTENDAVSIASAPNGTLAVLCAPRGGPADFVVVSTDAGETFGPAEPAPAGAAFTIAGPASLFLSVGKDLEASFDGGAHWSTVATDPAAGSLGSAFQAGQLSPFLGFESASAGRWVNGDQTVWMTTDGGHSWAPQAVSS